MNVVHFIPKKAECMSLSKLVADFEKKVEQRAKEYVEYKKEIMDD